MGGLGFEPGIPNSGIHAPKSAVETCTQQVLSKCPWLVWLSPESLIPVSPRLHLCCLSQPATTGFHQRRLLNSQTCSPTFSTSFRTPSLSVFEEHHPRLPRSPSLQPPCGVSVHPAVCTPPTHPKAKFPRAFPPPCPLSRRLPQHSLVSRGTMCLCHRQQCPFISGTAPVHSGTQHKGRFVRLWDVSSWLCHIGASNPSHQPGPCHWCRLCNSQSGLPGPWRGPGAVLPLPSARLTLCCRPCTHTPCRLPQSPLSLPAGLCRLEPGRVCRLGLHCALLPAGGLRHEEHPPGQLHPQGTGPCCLFCPIPPESLRS